MGASVATLIYACGIAGLYYLDRDKDIHTSRALWLPVIWLWILGSRVPSVWLGLSSGEMLSWMELRPIDWFFLRC